MPALTKTPPPSVPPPDEQLLRTDEFARMLAVSRRKALTLMASGELPIVTLGRRCRRVRLGDAIAFIQGRAK